MKLLGYRFRYADRAVGTEVASQGGLPKNPQWYANLAAHPDTRVSLIVRPRGALSGSRGRPGSIAPP